MIRKNNSTDLNIDKIDWNQQQDALFSRLEWLDALESTGSVSPENGWQPVHSHIKDANLPLYIKSHSWGEYVFDQSWAKAYQQHGFNYYPKLLNALPFTPVTHKRLNVNWESTACQLSDLCQEQQLSSWHSLFLHQEDKNILQANPQLALREDIQFHWFNRDWRCFDDFLTDMTSRKRKSIKKERHKVKQQGIKLQRLTGDLITPEHIKMFYQFYQATYYKRGQIPYLSETFFQQILPLFKHQMLLVNAHKNDSSIAMALCFFDQQNLYGRYWGCLEEYDCLHFEACYYQGIEFCLEKGIPHFDPGAQGQHKISRGFEPISTYSAHWIKDPGFRQAVQNFVLEEKIQVDLYKEELKKQLPFK